MPLNATQEEKKKAAARDHRRKLILEALFLGVLYKKFTAIEKDFQRTYARSGVQPDLFQHTQDIENILATHYGKVNSTFNSDIVKKLGKPDNYAAVQQEIETRHKVNSAIYSAQSSQIIGQTTHNNMQDAVKKVITDAALAGLFLTNVQISRRATMELTRKFALRVPIIALIETQRPAEHAKQTEAEALNNNNSVAGDIKFGLGGDTSKKEWVAILDNVTRQWHAEADSQVRDYNEPYVVLGERLMYPGDTSLGATMINIANCRCSSIPFVK